METRRALLAVALFLTIPACSREAPTAGGAPEPDRLDPSIAPLATVTPGATSAPAAGPTPRAPVATPRGPTSAAPAASPPAPPTGDLSDPAGDLTLGSDPAPAYVDLVRGEVRAVADGYEVRVSGAGAFPERGPEGRTLNVASFYEVDGDGHIDFEVWANLADSGWGTAYFNERTGRGRFGDESGVTVAVDEGALVLRFPAGHLEGARRFRWALATEWGRYETISTPAATRDAAPDTGAAAFPG